MTKLHWLLLPLLSYTMIVSGQTKNSKSGTITIQKEKGKIEGLYGKMIVHSHNKSNEIKNDSKQSAFTKSPFNFYFFFLSNGTLYQFETTKSPKLILEQIDEDPTKLRPILASYFIQDSIVSISPLLTGIMDGQEPVKSAYIGKLSTYKILLSSQNNAEVYQFEKLE